MATTNRRITLSRRPKGAVTEDLFKIEEAPMPDLRDGEVLVKTTYLSIDPTIRGWLERDTYLPAIEIGAVVRSSGVGEVVASRNKEFSPGDRVFAMVGWQEYSVHGPDSRLRGIPPGVSPTDALGVLGLNGTTAYFGLLDVGRPKAGETVVVSGAAGATGSVAGQIAKLEGCRVIGIAGSDAKCAWLTDEAGFDGAINYKTEDVGARLTETCPEGIDVFFDNVGGPILDEVLARLALRARVVLCGAISQYNRMDDVYAPRNYMNLVMRRARMEGFLVLDYFDRLPQAVMKLAGWVAEGKIKHRTTVVDGLENTVSAFQRLFSGDHEGKLVVRVARSDAPTS